MKAEQSEITFNAKPADQYVFMLVQHLVDETVIRHERTKVIKQRLREELNLDESVDEEF